MKKWLVASLMLALGSIGAMAVSAGELDVLLEKLVEKNVLTPVEAKVIKAETAQSVAKEVSKGESYALPEWVQKINLKGDVRVRYQYERDATDKDAKERGRIRYRLGMESKVGDVKAGAGLASGGSDPRSTNQSFEDTFATGDIRLDYAYAQYNPSYAPEVTLVAGKFPRNEYLWSPTDMLWDGDINPSGGSLNVIKSLSGYSDNRVLDKTDVFFNTGVWVMDENDHSDSGAPFLHYMQAGLKYNDEEKVDTTLAGAYYGMNNVQGSCLQWTAGSNTGVTKGLDGACTGAYTYDYNALNWSLETGVKDLFGGLPMKIDERIALFADYVTNVSNNVDQKNGWAFGMKFGNKKVKDQGSWQMKYQYVNLQKDAWLDTFPDSDRNSGATDVRSHEVVLEYALKKNIILGIDYYQTDWIKRASDTDHLLQADLLVKF